MTKMTRNQDKEDKELEAAIKESLEFSGKKRPLQDTELSERSKAKISRVEESAGNKKSLSLGPQGDAEPRKRRHSTTSRKSLFKDVDEEKCNGDAKLEEALQLSLNDVEKSEDEDLKRAIEISLSEKPAEKTEEYLFDSNEEVDGAVNYRLCSVISHFGSNATSGHYTADVYRFDEKAWYKYDD